MQIEICICVVFPACFKGSFTLENVFHSFSLLSNILLCRQNVFYLSSSADGYLIVPFVQLLWVVLLWTSCLILWVKTFSLFFVCVHVHAFVHVGDASPCVYGTGVVVKAQPWLLLLNCLLTFVWPAAFPQGRLAGSWAPRSPPVSPSHLTIPWSSYILHGIGRSSLHSWQSFPQTLLSFFLKMKITQEWNFEF